MDHNNKKKMSKTTFTKEQLLSAKPNSIEVTNSEVKYKEYFKLGGSVAKMDMATTRRYWNYKKSKKIKC